ncbi:hypothetical protein I215_06417 [Galbibacter marinus]|uniref:DUF2024 domain-containing protein n=1 Tax=Galbibacter marinus TaxID=555500 RepID=K2QLD7_9FLAO|nr:DUF2024 family protein [Galbibacter marinus]EKF55572.1 hypothetical protein I215_06417 [Galbibacter marinus]
MEIAVWDTYVKRKDNQIMHFDILVPSALKNENTIIDFGKHYLKSKAFQTGQITSKECRFCHIEQATKEMEASIKGNGYAIIEMENCD